ncbi:hypothetical protein SLA_2188 [Streptomyces laurentii]|uniref:Uncharacterized protein n=1 Tax=Streptomyces laurentii TaxID=39478 RepID=A0A160NYU3_STRLU|nr:hypothetical protein SLA_2188 [Streptomyces laurentii]
MWIGVPGSLREIRDGARSFDRSPDLGITEFRSLSGGVTVWAPRSAPRRLKMQWEAMQTPDVDYLDRLARRTDSRGPVAVLDPLSRNLLAPAQAAGRGKLSQWAPDAEIKLGLGIVGDDIPVVVEVTAAGDSVDLLWLHGQFHGYPVAPGKVFTWWAPGLQWAALSALRLYWYGAAKNLLSTTNHNTPGVPLVATAPAGAAYVRPGVRFSGVGTWTLGASVLAPGDISAELLAGEPPAGEGSPAYAVTGYSHTATAGDGRYRDIGLELVEVVSGAAG